MKYVSKTYANIIKSRIMDIVLTNDSELQTSLLKEDIWGYRKIFEKASWSILVLSSFRIWISSFY